LGSHNEVAQLGNEHVPVKTKTNRSTGVERIGETKKGT